MNKKICIVLREELLRCPSSTFHDDNKTKYIKPCDTNTKTIQYQNNIMESIINHIFEPHKNLGYDVYISGCVYECPHYDMQINNYFPQNTIKKLKPGTHNQAEMFHESVCHATKMHPKCEIYVSIRADYIMLRDINIHKNDTCIGYGWENNNYPDVDVFYVIPNKLTQRFKDILQNRKGEHICTYFINECLKHNNVIIYPVWTDYYEERTGIDYDNYKSEIEKHKKRPFVNYMRNR